MIKAIMWIVGLAAAVVFFAVPTAEMFPFQIMAGVVICAIFCAMKKMGVIYED